MSKVLKPPTIPKPEKIYSKGNPTKGVNRSRLQVPKGPPKPPKTTSFKPQKVSLSMVKPQTVKVTKTTKSG